MSWNPSESNQIPQIVMQTGNAVGSAISGSILEWKKKQDEERRKVDTNDSGLLRAVRAAVNLAISFDPMADDSAATVSNLARGHGSRTRNCRTHASCLAPLS